MAETNIRESLRTEVDECDWAALVPHFDNGAVIVVEQGQDLVDIGIAFAEDDKEAVQSWLKGGQIAKADEKMVAPWTQTDKIQFKVLIIRPFVLIQKITHH